MSEEKSKQLQCKPVKKVHLEVSDDVYRIIRESRSARYDIDHQVCTEIAEKEPTIIENKTRINGTPTEKISTEVRSIEKVRNNEKMHFEADQNKCSTNNEIIAINLERISSQESLNSDEDDFCCYSLSASSVASAKFSILISLVLLLISAQKFFKSSGEDDAYSKMLVFTAGVYALCYLHCARKLIHGIEKGVRDKFVAWIGFTVISVVLLFAGIFYVAFISWDELKDIHNITIAGCQLIAWILFLALIGCILIYCTRIVLLLWNSMHAEENSLQASCSNFISHFCNSCALSFSSFSRAVSH